MAKGTERKMFDFSHLPSCEELGKIRSNTELQRSWLEFRGVRLGDMKLKLENWAEASSNNWGQERKDWEKLKWWLMVGDSQDSLQGFWSVPAKIILDSPTAAALLMGFLPSSGLTQLSHGSESEKKSLITQVNESKRAPLSAFITDLCTYYEGGEAVVLSIISGDSRKSSFAIYFVCFFSSPLISFFKIQIIIVPTLKDVDKTTGLSSYIWRTTSTLLMLSASFTILSLSSLCLNCPSAMEFKKE